ncbi:hypothetical protein JTB14_017332 [Gonioctena quinquepunctata]|nr:hypothetical protein JTB14_017332 [Gonioctena quinquepunctata]
MNVKRSMNDIKNTLFSDDNGVELKNTLDNVKLIDDYPNLERKRKLEEENLELGTNKINIVKETREKRNNIGNDLLQMPKTSNTLKSSSRYFSSLGVDSNNSPVEYVMNDSSNRDSPNSFDDEPRKRSTENIEDSFISRNDMPILKCTASKKQN